jgi:hypothetical protein
MIDQDSTHHLRRHSEEMSPTTPIDISLVDEPEIHLVNQGGGLECVADPLASKLSCRDPTQLRVDQRQQFIDCARVTTTPQGQYRGDIRLRRHLRFQIVESEAFSIETLPQDRKARLALGRTGGSLRDL